MAKAEASPLLSKADGDAEESRKSSVIIVIAATMSISLSKVFVDRALDTTADAIARELSSPLVLTTVPAAGTCAYVIGKIIAVMFSYRFGGKISLVSVGIAGAVSALIMCTAQGAGTIFTAWLPWRLVSAWVWPASVAIIVAWVDAPNQGVAFSAQGLFWEGGGVIASVIYTAFFTDLWLWRLPFFIAASVCALAAAGVALLVTNKAEDMGMRPPMTAAALRVAAGTPPQTTVDAKKADAPAPPPPPPHPLDGTSSAHAISVMMGSVTYWIAFAASVSNGAVVYVIFYMPAWSMEALDAEPEHAAFLLVMCNLGGAVGLFIGGFLHDRLHSRGRSISNSIYGLTAAALLTVLPLLYGADTSGGLVSSPGLSIHTLQYMLLPIGYVVSVPYYINIVAFYADFGGRDHAATCSTFADVFMTIGAAATQELVGYFIGAQQYVEVLWLGAVMAWVYAICLLGFAAATYTHGYPLPPDVNSSGEHVRSA